jgi:hypothetical protein
MSDTKSAAEQTKQAAHALFREVKLNRGNAMQPASQEA